MKAKFTLLIGLFLLTTSIYAVKQTDEKTRNDAGNFLKNRPGMSGKSSEHYQFQRKVNFKKQEIQLKSAQAVKQRLDSYSFMEEDKGKVEFVYDVNGMLTHEREYYWDETTAKMVFVSVSETTYDDRKNKIQYMNTYLDEITNQFIIEYKVTYSYDNNGNRIQAKGYQPDSDKILILYFQYDYTYGTNGKLVQEIRSYINENTSQLEARYKTDYTYNGNGKETQQTDYSWDSYTSKQWEPSSKYESTYDSQGNLILLLESDYTYVNNTMTWKLRSKVEYTYDPNGNLTQELEYDLDNNNQLVLDDKIVYAYDGAGNNTLNFYYSNWDVQTNQWGDIYKEEYTYDNRYTKNDLILPPDWFDDDITHMITEIKGFYWDSSTNEWVSGYQISLAYSPVNVTSVNQVDVAFVNVYPNPFSKSVSFSIPDSYSQISFELFDIQGRKLISKAIGNNEKLSLIGLTSGMYLYNLNMDGKIQKGKLVKE
ncbi:MAG: hypothetical protein FD181_2098 [Prolixibacteraceae bacterium]|nr:MAG: hypothetical protein FD181_2098 [Prolixibacteraceae bacterium]